MFNFAIDATTSVQIRNKHYPVAIAGQGVPCLSIGLGSIAQRTLSGQFKEYFKVYSCDLYWDARYALEDRSGFTFDQLLHDLLLSIQALNEQPMILIGHSAWGIVTVEFAKRYPSSSQGLILIGTPVNSNADVMRQNQIIFEQEADPIRKQIDQVRRAAFAREDLSALTSGERFLRSYIFRDAPRYWHQPDFDCTELWRDIQVDDLLDHLFEHLLPNVDVRKDLEKINLPIFLAAGLSDYDCCPWQWAALPNLPPHMIISEFKQSGHYPNFEEETLFDQRVIAWARNNGWIIEK